MNNNIERFIKNRGNLECGEGWYALLDNFRDDLLTLIDDEEYDFDIIISQIKEKFGGLRIYINPTTDKIETLIEEYEEVAYNTCELCGEKGKLVTLDGGWMATLCDEDYNYYRKVKQTY